MENPTTNQGTTAPATPSVRSWLYPLLRRIHFYAGIFVAPFIFVAALTGAVYTFSPQIEETLYKHELSVPTGQTHLSIDEQVAAANAYIGKDKTPAAVRPALEDDKTTRVLYADDSLGKGEKRGIFVHPATGEILGDMPIYGTSGSLPFKAWLSKFHKHLQLGETGRIYSELAASWLWVIALGGAGLWILRARKLKSKREMIVPSNKFPGYRSTLSWHSSVGIWTLIGMVFFSVTGLTWSTYAGGNVKDLRAALNWSTPTVTKTLDGSGAKDGGEHADHGHGGHNHGAHAGHDHAGHKHDAAATNMVNGSYDHFLEMAQYININSTQVEIQPGNAKKPWIIQELQRSYPTEVDSVAINGATHEILDRADFKDFPLAAKLTRWAVDLHMGLMFGLINQIILFIGALGIVAMCIWGYVMWWQRRPRRTLPGRKPQKMGALPVRVALKSVPLWFWIPAALITIAIGLFLPVFGISLLGFLIIDLLLSLRHGKKA